MQLAEGYSELAKQSKDSEPLTINQALGLLARFRDPSLKAGGSNGQPTTEGQPVARYYRLSPAELKEKALEARRLKAGTQIKFTDDTEEGKLLKELRQALVEKLRKETEKLLARKEATGPVQAAHLLIALTEQLSLELSAETVFEVVEPEVPATQPSNAPAIKETVPPQEAPGQGNEAEKKGTDQPQAVEPANRVKDYLQGNGKAAQVA